MSELLVSGMLLLSGMLAVIGSFGLLRFPDFYTRSHAGTVVSVGAVSLALLALMIQTFWSIFSAKMFLIIVISMLANPASTHIIANVAYRKGVRPRNLVKNEWRKA